VTVPLEGATTGAFTGARDVSFTGDSTGAWTGFHSDDGAGAGEGANVTGTFSLFLLPFWALQTASTRSKASEIGFKVFMI